MFLRFRPALLPSNLRRWPVLLFCCSAAGCHAWAQGTAEISAQTYLTSTPGGQDAPTYAGSVAFRNFVPGFGLLTGHFEGGLLDGHGVRGRNFLNLTGALWRGRKLEIRLGDFELPASPIAVFIPGSSLPNFMASGAAVTIQGEASRFTVFAGEGFLIQGPRIALIGRSGQTVSGALGTWKLGSSLTVGTRLTYFSMSGKTAVPGLFDPFSSLLCSSMGAAFQARWVKGDRLQLFGEFAATHSQPVAPSMPVTSRPWSGEAAAEWKDGRLNVRAVYLNQTADYLPLTGFYLGGRRGGIGEFRFRLFRSVELSGGGVDLKTTAVLAPADALQSTRSFSIALSAPLKGRITANASYSQIAVFTLRTSDRQATLDNRMATLRLSRPIGRHTLRTSWIDMDITTLGGRQKQRSIDLEDTVRIGTGSIGGAIRWENQSGGSGTNNLAARAFWSLDWKKLNFFGSLEYGSDLVSRSLFTKATISTSTFGVRSRLGREWEIYADAYRTRLLFNLNSESALALSSQGVLPNFLFVSDHWTAFSSVTRRFSWNGGNLSGDLAAYTARQMPVTGRVEGFVSGSGQPVGSGTQILLDHDRAASTDAEGRYRFESVPEGRHSLELDLRHLPVEFDGGTEISALVDIRANRISRADFQVKRLGALSGVVRTAEGESVESVFVRAEPGGFLTSSGSDGTFHFDNIPEGAFEVSLDLSGTPGFALTEGGDRLPAEVKPGDGTVLNFTVQHRLQTKPVRRIAVTQDRE